MTRKYRRKEIGSWATILPRRFFYIVALAIVIASAPSCGGEGGDGSGNLEPSGETAFIVRWNRVAIDASGRDHTAKGAKEQAGPVRAARAMGVWAVAAADAVAAISGRFHPFLSVQASPEANMQAAIAQASHDALAAMYKTQAPIFAAALAEDLAQIPDSPEKDLGIALGQLTALNSIEFCENDGAEKSEPFVAPTYVPSNAAGKWRKDPLNPNQPIIGSNWSIVRPFVLESSARFRLPAPPAMESAEYARAFNEVKRLGGDGVVTPTERTLDQTVAGIYWAYDGTPSLCAPPRLYNQIATQIGLEQGLDLPDLTRLLALINISMMDAGSTSWDSKYHYNLWRPVTAIREADAGTGPQGRGDGNPATEGDPNWTPLGAPASNTGGKDFTPPFPAYPSGHATFGGAIFETIRLFFGTDEIPFTFVSDEFDGKTTDAAGNVRPLLPRSFRNLSEAEEENGQSRIYLGIHWSFDKSSGIHVGRQVAQQVFERAYTPIAQ